MNDNIVLKPCPFCGGEPYHHVWTEVTDKLSIDIAKVVCGCGVQGAERYGNNCFEDSRTAWNTRKEAK